MNWWHPVKWLQSDAFTNERNNSGNSHQPILHRAIIRQRCDRTVVLIRTIYGWFYSTRSYFITFSWCWRMFGVFACAATFLNCRPRNICQEMYANIFTKSRYCSCFFRYIYLCLCVSMCSSLFFQFAHSRRSESFSGVAGYLARLYVCVKTRTHAQANNNNNCNNRRWCVFCICLAWRNRVRCHCLLLLSSNFHFFAIFGRCCSTLALHVAFACARNSNTIHHTYTQCATQSSKIAFGFALKLFKSWCFKTINYSKVFEQKQ